MSKSRFEIAARERLHDLCGQTISVGTGSLEPNEQAQFRLGFVSLIDDKTEIGDVLEQDVVLTIQGDISPNALLVAPVLAYLLQVAEDASVELGSTVVVCGDCSLSKLFGEISKWWAPDRINLSVSDDNVDSSGPYSRVFRVSDDLVQEQLTEILASAPAVSFVDFSGSADAWDIMLESAPYWSRLVAAAPSGSPMTVDFYNNIHRKGVTLIGRPFITEQIFRPSGSLFAERHLSASVEILRNPSETARTISCLSA